MHGGTKAAELLNVTIEALKNLFEALVTRENDMDVSFTISFSLNERIVRVSSYGNIQNQLRWIKEQLPFPTDENGFGKWVIAQSKYLAQFEKKTDDPLITSLVQGDGVLYIKRKHVDLKYEFEEDEEGSGYKIEFPSKEDRLYKLIEKNKVQPMGLILVGESKWSDTGEDYYTSARSKFLDDHKNVAVQISGCEPLGLYWSKV
jgi:hypothetical protein